MTTANNWQTSTQHKPTLTYAQHRQPFQSLQHGDYLISHGALVGQNTTGPALAFDLKKRTRYNIPFVAVYRKITSDSEGYAMAVFTVDNVTLPCQYHTNVTDEIQCLRTLSGGVYWSEVIQQLTRQANPKEYKLVEILPFSLLAESYPL